MEQVNVHGSLGASDHNLISFQVKRARERDQNSNRSLDFRKANLPLLRETLISVPLERVMEGRNVHVQDGWMVLKGEMLKGQEGKIPLRRRMGG